MSSDSEQIARMFFVDTRFQRMARRPGGIPRAEAVKNAQAEIEESKPELEAWLDQELRTLIDITHHVRAGTAAPGWREMICLHGGHLRDVGTTVGFSLLTFIAGNLCEILDSPHAGGERDAELIACHVDALLLARQKQYRDLRPDQLPELSSGLRQVAESMRAAQRRASKDETQSSSDSDDGRASA
jgi:hypothetical protein